MPMEAVLVSQFYFLNVSPLRGFFSGGFKIVLQALNVVKSYLSDLYKQIPSIY